MQPPSVITTARDPILSLFQSAAAAVSRRLHGTPSGPLAAAAAHIVRARAGMDPEAQTSSTPQPAMDCAHLGLDLLHALAAGDAIRAQMLRDRLSFSECDPLWAETLLQYARLYIPDGTLPPIPYRRYADLSDFVIAAPAATLRVALLSDWGTGTNVARRVAALMAAQKPDIVIHLGDIYFSGTPEECRLHFLEPLRAVLPQARLFTLCGNHDAYSGGKGYYGLLDEIGQPASYLCLRSPDFAWQILAADTGLNDRNPFEETAALTFLDPAEIAWHADKLRDFPGRTLFLSHHQPFSAFRQIGPQNAPGNQRSPINQKLIDAHTTLSAAGTIDAWFWGHEHRLRLYAPYRGIAVGRNIGYGAIPVRATADADTPMAGLIDPPQLSTDVALDIVDGAYTHGFALLDLSPDAIQVSYWALTRPDGPVHRETLAASSQGLTRLRRRALQQSMDLFDHPPGLIRFGEEDRLVRHRSRIGPLPPRHDDQGEMPMIARRDMSQREPVERTRHVDIGKQYMEVRARS